MSSFSKNEHLFAALVSGYATQAMVGLGKVANPLTGAIERDLDQARALIDLLEMLEAKTEGNRSDEESSFLRQTLSTLRLNFVDEKNKGETPVSTASETPTEAQATPDAGLRQE
jgi:hypothetical protein